MKLVDLETAKALQELGYDGEYQNCYVNISDDGYETLTTAECKEYESDIDNLCPAPRLDDAAYWLRDKHKLDISVGRILVIKDKLCDMWVNYIESFRDNEIGSLTRSDARYPDYDTALETAVKDAIEIIKRTKP